MGSLGILIALGIVAILVLKVFGSEESFYLSDCNPYNIDIVNDIENHSADAMRYWAASSKLGTDTFFSEEELKASKRFINKLYNAAKFAMMQLTEFSHPEQYHLDDLLPIDRFMMERVYQTTENATKLLNDFEIGQARHEIDDLFWKDFCDYYIEIAKERLYQPEKHGYQEQRSGQIALYHSLLGILKLYAIYTPYVTEYIYQEFFRKFEKSISLHQMIWQFQNADPLILEFGEQMKKNIGEVRRQKTEKQMSMKDSLPELTITCQKKFRKFFEASEMDLKACTGAEKIILRS